jgi:hypothetical protein
MLAALLPVGLLFLIESSQYSNSGALFSGNLGDSCPSYIWIPILEVLLSIVVLLIIKHLRENNVKKQKNV